MSNNILITGATGFVGTVLCRELISRQIRITPVSRNDTNMDIFVKSIDQETDWSGAFSKNITQVIHLAARVHIMNEDKNLDPLLEYRKVNTYGTLNLARQAAASGVKRFIFISSIKVNGEFSEIESRFKPGDNYIPTDPYGLSKYEAEQSLKSIAKETGMEVVIIRPPLVYGPNVRANFRSMMGWVNKGVPLPFGAIHNKRSFIALSNLVDFIMCCLDHPKAANETFLISDGDDVSTTELLYRVGLAFGKKTRLIPVPVKLMQVAAKLFGKKDVSDRIFGNLQVNSSKAGKLLGWKPVITMEEELQNTVDAYLNEKNI